MFSLGATTTRSIRLLGILVVSLTLVSAGCGSGDGDGEADGSKSGAPEAQEAPEPGSNVPRGGKTVVAKVYTNPRGRIPADFGQWMIDIGIPPGSDPAFTVAKVIVPPGNANFRLRNPQAVGHDLVTEEVGRSVTRTPVFSEGSRWLRESLLVGERYVFYCSVPGHREAGMEGNIKVDPGLTTKDLKAF